MQSVVTVETTVETPLQVLRVKMFSTPFWTFAPKFVATDAKAMNWPVAQGVVEVVEHKVLMLGLSLNPFAGVVPSGVEMSWVEGVQDNSSVTVVPVQVSRT